MHGCGDINCHIYLEWDLRNLMATDPVALLENYKTICATKYKNVFYKNINATSLELARFDFTEALTGSSYPVCDLPIDSFH